MESATRSCIFGGVVLGVLMSAVITRAQTGAVLTAVPPGNDARPGFVFGYGFSIFTNDIKVLALGFYDKNSDGLAVSHAVGLYTPDGNLVTSVTVQAGTGSMLSNGYRYVFLDQPVLLYGSYGRVRYALAAVQNTDVTDQAAAGTYSNHWVVGDFVDHWISSSTLPTNNWIPSMGVGSVRFAPNALFEIVPITIRPMDNRSFVIAPTNVTASSNYTGMDPVKAINGSGLSNPQAVTNRAPLPTSWPMHDNSSASIWTTSGGPNIQEWITFQFDQVYQIEGFHLWNYNVSSYTTRGPYRWQISNSVDGVTWQAGPDHLPHALSQAPATTTYTGIDISFDTPVQAKYIKFCRPQAVAPVYCGLSEIRFIGFDPKSRPGTVLMIR